MVLSWAGSLLRSCFRGKVAEDASLARIEFFARRLEEREHP
jgi:hypothetical protein